MAYQLVNVLNGLKAYTPSTVAFDAAGTNSLPEAVRNVVAAMNVTPHPDLAAALADIVDSKKNTEYSGYTIYYVPTAEELLDRLAAAAIYEKMGLGSFQDNVQGASEVSRGNADKWLGSAMFNIPASVKKAWNDDVKKIKDAMVTRSRAAGLGVAAVLFPVGDAPHVLTISGVPTGTVRATPGVAMPMGAWTVGKVSANRGSWGMMGGSVSSHAPLYPSLVMNGGAHPFATFSGGDGAKAVAHIDTSIKAMENQFQLNSGQPLSAMLGTTAPSVYVTQVKNDIDNLEKAVNELRSANLALAQAPLAAGVQPDFQALVARGDEISKKAAKVSKGWDRLSQIHEALQQLVAKSEKVKLSGGLHNALKH